jgi:hypothetical protein
MPLNLINIRPGFNKHFGNHLMSIVVQWQMKFDDKIKNSLTYKDSEVVPDLKK